MVNVSQVQLGSAVKILRGDATTNKLFSVVSVTIRVSHRLLFYLGFNFANAVVEDRQKYRD